MDSERFYCEHGAYTDHLFTEDRGKSLVVGIWVDDDYATVSLDPESVRRLRLHLSRWEKSL